MNFSRLNHANRRKFNTYIFLVTLLLLILAYPLRLYQSIYQYVMDRRCLNELKHQYSTVHIPPGNKQELVQRFLDIYDVEIRNAVPIPTGQIISNEMNCRQVHSDTSLILGSALKWLSTVKITGAYATVDSRAKLDIFTGHTAKFQFYLEGGFKALFKVKKYNHTEIVGDLSKDYLGGERHYAEIASYHLQRILGFNRAPLVVGRKVDVIRELLPVADHSIQTNTKKIDGNLCIHFATKMALNDRSLTDKLCAEGTMLEGAMILWIPRGMRTMPYVNPMLKKYNNEEILRKNEKYPVLSEKSKRLDFIDTLILDYLIQNGDRHVFYSDPATYGSFLLLDNGKGFGNPYKDVDKALRVFSHGCQIRNSTFIRLELLQNGVLSTVLYKIMSRDPISPVLWSEHYKALDRRLDTVIKTVHWCLGKYSKERVLLEDEFTYRDSPFGALKMIKTHL